MNRIYDRNGSPKLIFGSGGAGLETGFLKSYAGTNFVAASVKWSAVQLRHVIIQRFTMLNGLFATDGAPTIISDSRVPRILDDPDTIYYWGVYLSGMHKYSITDGQPVAAAQSVGGSLYSKMAYIVSDFDVVVVLYEYLNTIMISTRSTSQQIASRKDFR